MRSIKNIKIVLALALIALLLWCADLGAVVEAFSHLSIGSITYLTLISILLIFISAVKWGYFLNYFGKQVSVFRLFGLYLVGYFVNLVLPSYLGGDAVRSWYVGKDFDQHKALAATVLERYTGIVAMVTLAFCFVWSSDLVTAPIRYTVILTMCGLVAGSVVAMSDLALRFISLLPLGSKVVPHLTKIQNALNQVRGDRALLAKTLGLSLLFHLFTVVNTAAAAWAVGWTDPPFLDLVVVVPIILLISAIPLAPNSLGIQEGAFYFFLQGVGASPAQAIGIALILRAKGYVLALFGGMVWISMRQRQKQTG